MTQNRSSWFGEKLMLRLGMKVDFITGSQPFFEFIIQPWSPQTTYFENMDGHPSSRPNWRKKRVIRALFHKENLWLSHSNPIIFSWTSELFANWINMPAEIEKSYKVGTHWLSWSEDEAVLPESIPDLYSNETYCWPFGTWDSWCCTIAKHSEVIRKITNLHKFRQWILNIQQKAGNFVIWELAGI